MPRSLDITIVGAGVMGSAAAWRLAKRGHRVRLLDQHPAGHEFGSSHGDSRVIRLAYHTPDYVALAREAYRLWGDLEQETGRTLMVRTGGLDLGMPDAEVLDEIEATYRLGNIPYERLDRAGIAERFPQFRLPDEMIGLWQADYSVLPANQCVKTLAEQAARHGASVRYGERVTSVRPIGERVVVETDQSTYSSDRVILTAGPWMGPMLARLGLDLPLHVSRETVLYMAVAHPERFTPERFPLVIHRFPGNKTLGGFFPSFGHAGIKALIDRVGPIIDPEDRDVAVDPEMQERIRRYAMDVIPDATGEVIWAGTCRYTMTPDEDFIIDAHPDHRNIVLASPCSGHGFKFAPIIGEILAELAIDGTTARDISRFALHRPTLQPARQSPHVA